MKKVEVNKFIALLGGVVVILSFFCFFDVSMHIRFHLDSRSSLSEIIIKENHKFSFLILFRL